MKFFPWFLRLPTCCIKYDTGDIHERVLSDREFHENRRSEKHTLFRDVHEFLFVFTTCIVLCG